MEKYLYSFLKQNNWENKYTREQARAIFTTICLYGDIYPREADRIMRNAFQLTGLDNQDIFENYMYGIIA